MGRFSDSKPVENIPNYPDMTIIADEIMSLPNGKWVDATELARKAGSSHTANVVLIGTASKYLPIPERGLLTTIENMFSHKGKKIIEANFKAFHLGKQYELDLAEQCQNPTPCCV